MWRLANYIYRAFRTVATHRCPQDIIVPVSTVSTKDEESNREKYWIKVLFMSIRRRSSLIFRNKEILTQCKSNIHQIIKKYQFSSQNVEKLQEYLHQISRQQVGNFTKKADLNFECLVNLHSKCSNRTSTISSSFSFLSD